MEKNEELQQTEIVENESVINNEEVENPVETTLEETDEPENDNDKVSDWEAKCKKWEDDYLRLYAEYDNYRKRTLKEKAELIKSAGENILVNILPLVDDFERAMKAVENSDDVKAVKEGVELIYGKFISFLNQNGVKVIEADGKEFDTEFHEAVTTIPAPSEELKGKVVDTVQKGYTLYDKVIRFTKAVIGG